MKQNSYGLFSKLVLVQLAIALSLAAWAGAGGGMDGGGGDSRPPESGSAWFLGIRTIRYCYVVGDSFGVTHERIESAIEASFAQWQAYVEGNRIYAERPTDWRLDFNRTLMAGCDGSEDLKFYFGVMNSEVQAAKAAYMNPTAISQRTTYDVNTGWGKGLIWLGDPETLAKTQPNTYFGKWPWGQGDALEFQLLHELGHVYGCAHVDGTIMREDIAREIFSHGQTTIDGDRTLAGMNMPFLIKHQKKTSYGEGTFSVDVFKKFVGYEPQTGGCSYPPGYTTGQRCILVELVPPDLASGSNSDSTPSAQYRVGISLSDSVHQRVVWFEPANINGNLTAGSSYLVNSPAVFKVARMGPSQWEGGPPMVSANTIPLFGVVIMGSVTDAAGNTQSAMMTINMNMSGGSNWGGSRGPLGIFYFDGPVQKPLFGE